jgi:phage virion morphogenesis protein
MTGARITYKLDDKTFEAAVTKLGGVLRTGVMRQIGVALVEQTNRRFDAGRDPFGQKWQALLPAYAMIKRGPGILRASQMLQRSVTYAATGNQVTVGSNRIYAAVHQFGATITAKNGKGLAFMLGSAGPRGPRGGKSKTLKHWVHAQSVRIPQRPYLGFGPNDQRAVMEVVAEELQRTFGG